MQDFDEIAATREFTERAFDGAMRRVRIRLGRPQPAPGGGWECRASLDTIPIVARGEDSWGALIAALQLIEREMRFSDEQGFMFYELGSGRNVNLEELFGRTKTNTG